MAKSIETDEFLLTHAMVDCQRMSARITAETCVKYQRNNDALACVGCSRCAPGELGKAAEWLPYIHSGFGLPKK